ncbi:ABC transporter permease [Mordavella massiliensis]|uniref:ABC transporter permease n=1 Tax=Mordavella massiliensis TaxID=1871024 RepID=A0A939BFH6_9CLOT|nr:ABC transporter permease [Mordavella massiliensis]MBM6948292.1 ABC transporter permease [Mordavella massiliensis]
MKIRKNKTFQKAIHNKSVVIGTIMVLAVILIALLAPFLSPYDLDLMNMENALQPPSGEHLFGTDQYGRDLMTRIFYGARISLIVGFVSVFFSMVIGVLVGLIAGYYGGWIDNLIGRIIDVFLSFPVLLLAIALVAVLGGGTVSVIISLCLVSWTQYARVVRSSVLVIREEEYVLAARTFGASNFRILFKYVIPNALAPIIVVATLGIGTAIVSEATLSFMGLGVQPPTPSWGYALSFGLRYMRTAAHMATIPGLAIMFTVLGFNLLGNGIRDITDPRMVN